MSRFYRIDELNATWLRNTYLPGIELDNLIAESIRNKMSETDKNVFFNNMLQNYIDSAITNLENQLDIVIYPERDVVEKHDYEQYKYQHNVFIQCRKRPIISITSFTVKMGNVTIYEYPSAWHSYQAKWGQVQLVPETSTLTELYTYPLYFASLMRYSTYPNVFNLTFDAGLEMIEADMAQAIGHLSAIQVLERLGPLVLDAGIASFSMSMDGISTSVGTTASAENDAFSGTIRPITEDLYGYRVGIPGEIDALKSKWMIPAVSTW